MASIRWPHEHASCTYMRRRCVCSMACQSRCPAMWRGLVSRCYLWMFVSNMRDGHEGNYTARSHLHTTTSSISSHIRPRAAAFHTAPAFRHTYKRTWLSSSSVIKRSRGTPHPVVPSRRCSARPRVPQLGPSLGCNHPTKPGKEVGAREALRVTHEVREALRQHIRRRAACASVLTRPCRRAH